MLQLRLIPKKGIESGKGPVSKTEKAYSLLKVFKCFLHKFFFGV